MTISSFLILILDLSKSPIFFYIFGFLFIKIANGYKFNFVKVAKYTSTTLLSLLFIYSLLADTSQVKSIWEYLSSYNTGIIGRIILSQAAGTYLALEAFPSLHPHIGFNSLTTFIPNYSERMGRIVMEIYNASAFESGTAGSMNTLFIAEAWANFGLIGIIISPLIVGFIIQLTYQTLISGNKTPLKLGIYGYFCVKMPVTGGFNDFIYNLSTIIIVIVFYGLYLMAKSYRK